METFHFICQQWFGVEKEDGKVDLSRWFDDEPSASTLFIAYRSTVFWLWPVHLNANSSHLFCLNKPIVIWLMIIFGIRSLLVQRAIDSPVFNDVHRVSFFSFSRCFWTSCITISPLRVKWTMTQATPSPSDLFKSHLNRSVHLSFSSPPSLSLRRWRKIVIGIIVELLTFLPSLLIVQLFRRVRRRSQSKSSCSSSMTLPWWSLFLIYGLCLISMILSIFFIVARGIEFGDFKAQQWLTSILSGLFSSVLLTQPLKVFFRVTKVEQLHSSNRFYLGPFSSRSSAPISRMRAKVSSSIIMTKNIFIQLTFVFLSTTMRIIREETFAFFFCLETRLSDWSKTDSNSSVECRRSGQSSPPSNPRDTNVVDHSRIIDLFLLCRSSRFSHLFQSNSSFIPSSWSSSTIFQQHATTTNGSHSSEIIALFLSLSVDRLLRL